MAYKIPGGNRRLKAANTKAVPYAIKRIETTAAVAQQRLDNTLKVNGFPCIVYNRLSNGVKCTCTQGVKNSPITPILDVNGNASKAYIQELVQGSSFEITPYAETISDNAFSPVIYDVDRYKTQKKEYAPTTIDNDPLGTDLESELNIDNIEFNADMLMTGKCNICFGSGYVGGYSLHNGNRIVLDSTWAYKIQNGYTVVQTDSPFSFEQLDPLGYVEFNVVIPFGAYSLDALNIWNNTDLITNFTLQIGTLPANLIPLTPTSILSFANGTPAIIRISGVSSFTHIELQFNMSDVITYLEYPRVTKTGDLSVLEALDAVQLYLSPLIYQAGPYDIIYDTIQKKYWRITTDTDFKDRLRNIQGWDVQARLVQQYEIYSWLPSRTNNNYGMNITTNLPRY